MAPSGTSSLASCKRGSSKESEFEIWKFEVVHCGREEAGAFRHFVIGSSQVGERSNVG